MDWPRRARDCIERGASGRVVAYHRYVGTFSGGRPGQPEADAGAWPETGTGPGEHGRQDGGPRPGRGAGPGAANAAFPPGGAAFPGGPPSGGAGSRPPGVPGGAAPGPYWAPDFPGPGYGGPAYGGPEAGRATGGPAGPRYDRPPSFDRPGYEAPPPGSPPYPPPGAFPGGPPSGQRYGQHPFEQQPGAAGSGPAGPGFPGDQRTGYGPGPYGDSFDGQGPGGFPGSGPGTGFAPGTGDPSGQGFAGPGAAAGGPPGYPPPGQFPGSTGQGPGTPGGPYQAGPTQAGFFAPGQQQAPPGYYAAGMTQAGPPAAGPFVPPGQFSAGQAFPGAPAAQYGPGWTGQAAPSSGAPGNSRPRTIRQVDDDPDRVLTPTTIFAPGSLVTPPDDGEGDRFDSRPSAGPAGTPPGYGTANHGAANHGAPPGSASFPGQGPWSAPGAFPQAGAFPGAGTAPGPGTVGGASGQGGFPGNGGPAGGAGHGAAGYPAPGRDTPRFDHPYPAPGGTPFTEVPGAAPPGFPGSVGYGVPNHGVPNHGVPNHGAGNHGTPSGERFSGPSAAPPGYPRDPGHQPRPQAPGWYGPDDFRSRGDIRVPGGQPYPAPPGPAGYPGPGVFPGPAGPPPGYGYPGPAGPVPDRGHNAFPGQADYRGYAGPGGPQAPYAEYRVWQPQNGPGDYPDAGRHDETVNGGGYAYVIREDDPGVSTASSASPSGSARADGVRAITSGDAGTGSSGAATPVDPVPAAGAPATDGRVKPEAVADLDPALAYGPDDPAYGPPGPDWYKQRAEVQSTPRTEEADSSAPGGEARPVRGPFEPLRPEEREEARRANYELAGDDAAFGEPGTDQPESDIEISDYEPIDYEMSLSEQLDFGTPTDPEAGALGQIRDLYQTAETVSQASLDRHFEQLLEKQRQLISEYFQESLDSAEASTPVVPVTPAAALGFDTAESLAALRDEFRGAQ